MIKFTRTSLAVLSVAFLCAAVANATPAPSTVPEINTEMGAGALALIAGVVTVIRGRRKA